MAQVRLVDGHSRPKVTEEILSLHDVGFGLNQEFHRPKAPPGEFDSLLSQEDLTRRQRDSVSPNLKNSLPIGNLVLGPELPHFGPVPAISVRRIVYRVPNLSQLFI